MNKKYFAYLWKHYKKAMIIVTVIISIITISTPIFTYIDPIVDKTLYSYLLSDFVSTLTSIITAVIFIFVLVAHSIFYKKQTVDMHFSIPVTKKEISFTSSVFIYGFSMIIYLTLFILGGVILLLKGVPFNVLSWLLYLLMGIVSLTLVSSIINLACSLANNLIDAVLTYGIGSSSLVVVLFFIFLIVYPFLPSALVPREVLDYFMAFSGVSLRNGADSFIEANVSLVGNIEIEGCLIVSLAVSLLKIPGYSYLANRFNKEYQAEDASTPSNNKFGIKNLVFPLYFICSFITGILIYAVFASNVYVVLTMIAILCIFILVGIYVIEGIINRSFRINKKELLRIFIPFVCGIIIGIIYMALFKNYVIID